MPDASWRLVYTPSRDDTAAYLLLPRETPAGAKLRFVGALVLAGMAAPFVLEWSGLLDPDRQSGWAEILTGAGIAALGWLIHTIVGSVLMTRRLRRIPPAGPERIVTADAAGVTVESAGRIETHGWADFGAIVRGREHVHLCLTPDRAITVPRRAFPDDAAMTAFAGFADEASKNAAD